MPREIFLIRYDLGFKIDPFYARRLVLEIGLKTFLESKVSRLINFKCNFHNKTYWQNMKVEMIQD